MTAQPYTKEDLKIGEKIVQELHAIAGYEAWVEHIAKAIASERERCAKILEDKADLETNSLCCADNSITIHNTHRWARSLITAAGLVRGEKWR